jgi:2-amino-4-hydroxy-6-hydroxymethyldihydropteridine diphosphokinase
MIALSLGANVSGPWGQPQQTLRRALAELHKANTNIISTSKLYPTIPYGIDTQNIFLNAVILVNSSLSAPVLLQTCQRIEAQAGRKPTRQWRSRPLDIDIVDYKRLICNWTTGIARESSKLILPHPHAHERAFVLRPLAEIAPFWHHPVFGATALQLLKSPAARETGAILGPPIDF